jgi:glycosyltransferase involved in cell wall biosynthesis
MELSAMNSVPRVSVVIPTYNRLGYLQIAIDSALAQTSCDCEIIVVDDGSTDGTGAVLRAQYGQSIRYEYQENRGESAARNRAIELAQGEYIALLDSDDAWLPEKISRQVTALDADPDAGMVFCQAWLIDQHGDRIGDRPEGFDLHAADITPDKMLFVNQIGGPSTTLIRRSVLQVVGFDPSIRFGEDWDLFLQMLLRGYRINFISEPLAYIRRHRGTQCYYPSPEKNARRLQDHLRLLTKAFANWPGVVPEDLRRSALARQYAESFLYELAVDASAVARDNLRAAHELAPALLKDTDTFGQLIVDQCAAIAEEADPTSFDRALAYLQRVLDLMADLGAADTLFTRAVTARVHAVLGFMAHSRGETGRAQHQLASAIRLDSRWLRNGGVLSILARSVISRRRE